MAQLRAGVDALLCADVSGLEGASLIGQLQAFEVERRRLEAVEQICA